MRNEWFKRKKYRDTVQYYIETTSVQNIVSHISYILLSFTATAERHGSERSTQFIQYLASLFTSSSFMSLGLCVSFSVSNEHV